MNLINNEIERIYKWACDNQKNYFFSVDKNTESYYQPFDDTNNVLEYGVETVPELTSLLLEMWNEDDKMCDIAKVCAVSAFKLKPDNKHDSDDTTVADIEIPDFVYNF